MPWPVSATVSDRRPPSASASASARRMVRVPPCSRMAWKALAQRFMTICWICTGVASTRTSAPVSCWSMAMVAGRLARSSLRLSRMIGAMSTGTFSAADWRLKVRICCTRSAARRPPWRMCRRLPCTSLPGSA